MAGDDSAVQGFTILDSLIDNPLYLEYYKEIISIDETGTIQNTRDFSYDVVVDLLFQLVQYDEELQKSSITHLNLAEYSKKAEIPYAINNLPNLVYLDVSNEPGDYEDTTFSALIKMLEGLENLTHLKSGDWWIFQTFPAFFNDLESVSFRGARLPEITKEDFRKLPRHLKLAYVEYTIGDYAHPNRFDSEMEDLIEHFEGHMSTTWNGSLKIDEAHFHGPLAFSSYVMLLAHQKYSLNLSEVTNIEMTSRFVDFLKEMRKLTDLTIDVDVACESIHLSSHKHLTSLTLHNFPKSLRLTKDKLRYITVSGDLTQCERIYRGRKKFDDFYEGLAGISISKSYYDRRDIFFPPPTQTSLPFINDRIKNLAWEYKTTDFGMLFWIWMHSYVKKKPTNFLEISEYTSFIFESWSTRYISTPQKRGQWTNFEIMIFLLAISNPNIQRGCPVTSK